MSPWGKVGGDPNVGVPDVNYLKKRVAPSEKTSRTNLAHDGGDKRKMTVIQPEPKLAEGEKSFVRSGTGFRTLEQKKKARRRVRISGGQTRNKRPESAANLSEKGGNFGGGSTQNHLATAVKAEKG